MTKGLIDTSTTAKKQITLLRNLLQLPIAERNALLAQQVATITEYFRLGSEEIEWVEDYIENDNWDDE